MRSFLAIELNQTLKNELSCLQDKLKKKGMGFRWVNPELLHITLRFLGNITPEHLSFLEKPFQELGTKTAAFNLSLAGLEVFPHKSRPRVLWLGVKEGVEEIINLAMAIEEILKRLDLSFYRKPPKIIPHLTIARQKNADTHLPPDLFEEDWVCKNMLYVDRFSLIKSTLHSSGPVYNTIEEFLLK